MPELYFDFLSPFSYLHFKILQAKIGNEDLNNWIFKPVLMGSLFQHWGFKGPGEILPKKKYLTKVLHLKASKLNVKLQQPENFPFNSFPLLKIVAHLQQLQSPFLINIIEEIFYLIYDQRMNPDLIEDYLNQQKGIVTELSSSKIIKKNLAEAIEKEIFGVPTIWYGNEIFWGTDDLNFFMEKFYR